MMIFCVSALFLFAMVSADDPILDLSPGCPLKSTGSTKLVLTADVPAHVVAKCKNGVKTFITTNNVAYFLLGSFDKGNAGTDCLFYKKKGSNTYTVDVAVGWGEDGNEVMDNSLVYTISCAYDKNGEALTGSQKIGVGFIAPPEIQVLRGKKAKGTFLLKSLDVLDKEITANKFQLGRKMRIRATETSGSVVAFRALSCTASNGVTSYAILRAGCGDGLVFPKTSGFETKAGEVYSPYFDAFRLRGSDTLKFQCNFTVCKSNCDGDSCTDQARKRRSIHEEAIHEETIHEGSSEEMRVRLGRSQRTDGELILPAPRYISRPNAIRKVVGIPSLPAYDSSLPEKSQNTEIQDLQIFLLLSIFLCLFIVTFITTLYLCCKYEIIKTRTTES